jgi:oligopeptide/dipeptide ABC transporter ATP-binding protein
MRQRLAIALVLALRPKLVIFDEPTTALDVLTQQQVMRTIKNLQHDVGFAALLISHDLGVVLDSADRILVMYGGRLVEEGRASTLLRSARHPYTKALLSCYADPQAENVEIGGIPGGPPDLARPDDTCCSYAPRCPLREPICLEQRPTMMELSGTAAACFVANREAERHSRVL